MVVPWVGYSLAELIRRVEPTGNAKFVEFTTPADPKQMPGLRSGVLDWPHVEGLRMDEAMQPLALLAFGPTANCCRTRTARRCAWSCPGSTASRALSIVRIRFVEKQPRTSWEPPHRANTASIPNVNPTVDHPRWSQATERRRIGEDGLFARRRPTTMFNGYEAQVAQLYAGMDLQKIY